MQRLSGRRFRFRAGLAGLALAVVLGAGTQRDPQAQAPVQILSQADVLAVLAAGASALADPNLAVSVVDRAGTILGVYQRNRAATLSLPLPPQVDLSIALARTGAFFSNDQAPLSSRTVRFISGIHFPPGIANTPNAATAASSSSTSTSRCSPWSPPRSARRSARPRQRGRGDQRCARRQGRQDQRQRVRLCGGRQERAARAPADLRQRDPRRVCIQPRPEPKLIATYKTLGPALSISKGLDRDRAVDESGHQVAVFGRRGARPFNLQEMQRMFLRDGQVFTVTDGPAGDERAPGLPQWPAAAQPRPAPPQRGAPPPPPPGRERGGEWRR